MKMTMIEGFKTSVIEKWSEKYIEPNTIVISDGLACFRGVASENKQHFYSKTGGDLDKLEHPTYKWVNTMIGNVKNSLRGICQDIWLNTAIALTCEISFRDWLKPQLKHRLCLTSY